MPTRSLIIFILTSFTCLAQDFVTKHPNCRVGIYKEEKESFPKTAEQLEEQLKAKGYTLFDMHKNKKLFPGELYAHFETEMLGEGWFPDCYVKLTILEAEKDEPRKSDPTFFKKSIKRKFPRIFWSGSYRCKLALKDIFIHVPYCRVQ
ncbi:MAG: hypothetical protein ACO20H_03490 [Bacteriovoracaceae bacterium]